MKDLKKIILVLILVAIFNLTVIAQPSNLTDRELLIQLYSKVDSIEKSVNKIADSSESMQTSIVLLDKRISKNETNITTFCAKIDDLGLRWNALLGLFATFILGLFIWMWKRVYSNRKT